MLHSGHGIAGDFTGKYGFKNRIGRGWRITKLGIHVVKADPELIFYVLFSAIMSILSFGAVLTLTGGLGFVIGNDEGFEGGVASIKQDLTIDESTLIGNYDAQNVYSVETIGDRVYVGTYDGYVKVLTENNIEIADYKVGDFPGDFEMWRK